MKEEQIWILLSKKITGEASSDDLLYLDKFVSENTEWQFTIDRLQEVWNSNPPKEEVFSSQNQDFYLDHINRLKNQVSDFTENEGFEAAVLELDEKPLAKPFFSWKNVSIAASIVSVFFVSYFLLFNAKPITQSQINEVKVSKGSKSKVLLPDGSQVWINAGSKLTYSEHFKKDFREVTLEGEAYFDVVKDKEHPFIVHTSGIDIKVLGTAFNVKAYASEPTIEATLIHGSIEVTNINQPNSPHLMLKPHEKMIFNKAGEHQTHEKAKIATIETRSSDNNSSILVTALPKKMSDTAIIETAWIYNKLVFEDEKFGDVIIKMERWYNVNIHVTDEKLKNTVINGSFVDESIDEALEMLQLFMPFKYKNVNNEITISRK